MSCASQTIATAPSTMPSISSGRGPTRARKTMFTDVAVIMIAAVIGRNARPVWIGVKPLVCCR